MALVDESTNQADLLMSDVMTICSDIFFPLPFSACPMGKKLLLKWHG